MIYTTIIIVIIIVIVIILYHIKLNYNQESLPRNLTLAPSPRPEFINNSVNTNL